MSHAKLQLNGTEYELPVVTGTENERGIDIGALRSQTGGITAKRPLHSSSHSSGVSSSTRYVSLRAWRPWR